MKTVPEVMARLASKFQPEQAQGMNKVFQIDITDDHPYMIHIRGGECQVEPGEHSDPDVTLIMDSQAFADIIYGDLGGTSAFLSGRLRAEGDVMLATKLGKLFKRKPG